jgi:hypothetical protein
MKKKNSRYFWWLLLVLFVVYSGFTIANETGYYETKLKEKTYMTEKEIEKFEKDVKDGKALDIKEYMKVSTVDNNNTMSDLGETVSHSIEYIMTEGLDRTFKVLGKLFGS